MLCNFTLNLFSQAKIDERVLFFYLTPVLWKIAFCNDFFFSFLKIFVQKLRGGMHYTYKWVVNLIHWEYAKNISNISFKKRINIYTVSKILFFKETSDIQISMQQLICKVLLKIKEELLLFTKIHKLVFVTKQRMWRQFSRNSCWMWTFCSRSFWYLHKEIKILILIYN